MEAGISGSYVRDAAGSVDLVGAALIAFLVDLPGYRVAFDEARQRRFPISFGADRLKRTDVDQLQGAQIVWREMRQ